jgi:hypothetical protein
LCTFCGHFVNLLTILVFCAKKSGNPDLHTWIIRIQKLNIYSSLCTSMSDRIGSNSYLNFAACGRYVFPVKVCMQDEWAWKRTCHLCLFSLSVKGLAASLFH